MRWPIRLTLAAAACTLLALPAGCVVRQYADDKSVNLLVNGGFEEGVDVDGFLALDPGSEAVKGWTVTRGQIDLVGAHWVSGEGGRSLDLHG